jgi:hypothetical protein
MQDKKFLEYRVEFEKENERVKHDKNGLPIVKEKRLTDRGHVLITEQQANWYNRRTAAKSGIFYILDEVKEEKKPAGRPAKK